MKMAPSFFLSKNFSLKSLTNSSFLLLCQFTLMASIPCLFSMPSTSFLMKLSTSGSGSTCQGTGSAFSRFLSQYSWLYSCFGVYLALIRDHMSSKEKFISAMSKVLMFSQVSSAIFIFVGDDSNLILDLLAELFEEF